MNFTRREFAHLAGMAAASTALRGIANAQPEPDFTLNIAPTLLEASPKHHLQTIAYNGQIPGPLLRMRQGRPVTVEVHNNTADPEIVHFHGLFLPSEIDGAVEEGTPMIAPGASASYTFTPQPAGFRWFHTHTFAGKNLRIGQYTGQHGFILIDPATPAPAAFDREIFLALHDWSGYMMASDDGSMMPVYDFCTINGKMLGFGEPLRVKRGERIQLQVLNSSPTEVHWLALPGHTFYVIALDGNPVPTPQHVDALRIAPAERITAIVEMNSPGVWILGELSEHLQKNGMGIVVEYANATGTPQWIQPKQYGWDYWQFAAATAPAPDLPAEEIPLTFNSKFRGHGDPEEWTINGKSYPHTEEPVLQSGHRYRLVMKNLSTDNHPIHLHRHTFELRQMGTCDAGGTLIAGSENFRTTQRGLMKDVVLLPAKSTGIVEFTANDPGKTLFHCHQQDHMDNGFMMTFRYA